MRPAVPILQEALKKMDINNPRIPVYSNVGGKTHTNSGHVLKLLPMQVVSPVKWEQSMVALFDYKHPELTPNVYECGPGNGSLSGILKAIRGKASKKANYVPV